jgi:hypothetical protein
MSRLCSTSDATRSSEGEEARSREDGPFPSPPRLLASSPLHPLGGLQREPAGEHGQTAEEALLGVAQQVVAPGDGVAQGLVTGRRIARAAGQQAQAMAHQRQHRGGGEEGAAGGCQLDGQREPVELTADFGHGGDIGVVHREPGARGADLSREECDSR